MVTGLNGSVVARHDYLPYGEEIPGGTFGRSGTDDFGVSANVNQKFTGQERDPEMTPNSDFFNARYFSAAAGSFLRPDPANAGADLGSPQSWNGYGYVSGNPLGFVDPSGMNLVAPGPGDDPCFVYDAWCSGPGPVPPCFDCGGGIPGGSGPSGSGPGRNPPTPTSGGTPLPPNSFPGGETLGLPPGLRIPGPFGIGLPNPFVFSVCSASDPNCLPAGVPLFTMDQYFQGFWWYHGSGTTSTGKVPNSPALPPLENSWYHPLTMPTCQQWKNWGKGDAFIAGAAAYVMKQAPVTAPVAGPIAAIFGGSAVIENGIAMYQGCFY